MASSSSSSSVPGKVTIVVGPVELTVIPTNTNECLKQLEKLAADFALPLPQLISSGCVKVFHGDEVPLRVREASVSPEL